MHDDPDAQHVDPDQPVPPHCPYKAEQLPLAVVVTATEVVLDLLDTDEVTVLLLVPVNLTVTTEYEGSDTVAEPPDSVTVVELTECELSVSQAVAAEAVKPLNDTAADWAELPLLVKTTTTLPSVFLNAPIATFEIVPDVPTLTAPGRMKRLHIAKAHSLPEAVAVAPSSTATR